MALPAKSDLGNSLDLVDIEKIEENVVVMKNGSLKQVVMVGGVNFALKSELEKNVMTQAYQNFLNGIDFPLQVVIHSRKVNVAKYIAGLLTRKDAEESPLLKNQIDEYAEFIKGFVEKNAIMEKSFLVVVPFYPTAIVAGKKTVSNLFPFLGKKNAAEQAVSDAEAQKAFKENVAQLAQRTAQVTSGLMGIGLEAAPLENDALIELFYNFYNPQTVEREGVAAGGGTADGGERGTAEKSTSAPAN